MFGRFYAPLALALGLVVLGTSSRAATLYEAFLDGTQEVGPKATPGFGYGTVLLNDTQDQITVNEWWAGLTAPATLSHIHTGAVGVAGPVTFPFTGVPNATSGSIPEQTFAINATQLAQLQAGNMYFNVHTSTYPGGEIRGQIGASPVPEPASLAFLLTGAPAGRWMVRRRKTS